MQLGAKSKKPGSKLKITGTAGCRLAETMEFGRRRKPFKVTISSSRKIFPGGLPI
jgi:hypothetical protein